MQNDLLLVQRLFRPQNVDSVDIKNIQTDFDQ